MEILTLLPVWAKVWKHPNSYLSLTMSYSANPVGSIKLIFIQNPITFHHLHRAITPDKATQPSPQGLLVKVSNCFFLVPNPSSTVYPKHSLPECLFLFVHFTMEKLHKYIENTHYILIIQLLIINV